MKIAGTVRLDDLPRIAPLLLHETNPDYQDGGARPVDVRGVRFGGDTPAIIAGPCAVESYEQTLALARAVRGSGGVMLCAGAYKPRTAPYDFQGLGLEGLRILRAASEETLRHRSNGERASAQRRNQDGHDSR